MRLGIKKSGVNSIATRNCIGKDRPTARWREIICIFVVVELSRVTHAERRTLGKALSFGEIIDTIDSDESALRNQSSQVK